MFHSFTHLIAQLLLLLGREAVIEITYIGNQLRRQVIDGINLLFTGENTGKLMVEL